MHSFWVSGLVEQSWWGMVYSEGLREVGYRVQEKPLWKTSTENLYGKPLRKTSTKD